MSVFKKITSLLFEESEEDVIAEDELKNVYLKEQQEVKEEQEETKVSNITKEEQVITKPVVESSKFVNINLNEQPQKPVRKEMDQGVKSIRVKTIRNEEKKEYEFTPVISPMFGADEEEKKKEKAKKVIVSPPISSRKHKKKENPLGTIISPYFGIDEQEESVIEKEEVEETIVQDLQERQQDVSVSLKEEVELMEEVEPTEQIITVEEPTTALSLEDMLLSKGTKEMKEETLQISIFGNHSVMKEEKDDSVNKES